MNLVMEGLATIGGVILGTAAEAAPVVAETAGEIGEVGAGALEVGALGASKMASRGSAEVAEQAARSEAEAAEHTADAPVSSPDTRSLGKKIKDFFTPNPGVESARDIGGKLVGTNNKENLLWTKAIADHTSLVDATESVKNWKPEDAKQLYQLLSDQLKVSPGRDMSMKLNALFNEPEKFLNTKDPIILSDIKNLQRLSKGNPQFKLDLLNKIGQAGEIDQIKEGPVEQLYYKSKNVLKTSETKPSINNKLKWQVHHDYEAIPEPENFNEAIESFKGSHVKSLYHGILDAKNFTQAEKHQLFKGMYDFINTGDETALEKGLAEEARIHNMTNAEVTKLFEPVQAKLDIMKKLKQAAAFGMDKQYADIKIPTPESTETEIYNFTQALNKLHPDNKALVEAALHPDVKAKTIMSIAPDISNEASLRMSMDAEFQDVIKKIDRIYTEAERPAERRTAVDIYRKGGTNLADYNKKLDTLLIKIPKQTVEGVTEGSSAAVLEDGIDKTLGNLTKIDIKHIDDAVSTLKSNIGDKAKAVEVVEELRASNAPTKQLTAAEQRLAKIKEESALVKSFEKLKNPESKAILYDSLSQDKKDILNVLEPKGKETNVLEDDSLVSLRTRPEIPETLETFEKPQTRLEAKAEDFAARRLQLGLERGESIHEDVSPETLRRSIGENKNISPIEKMDPQLSPSEAAAEEGVVPTTDPLETLPKPDIDIDPASATGKAAEEGMIGEPVEGEGEFDKKGFFTSDGFKAAMGGLFGGAAGGGIIAGLVEGVDKLKQGDFSAIKSAVDTVSKIGKTIQALEKDYKKYLNIWNGAGGNRAAGEAAKRGMERTRNEMNRLKQEETKASGNLKRAVMKAEGDIKNAATAAKKKAIADKEYKGKGTQDKVSSGLLKDTSIPSIKIYNNFQSPESFLKSEDDFSTITKKNTNSKNKTSSNTEKADRKGKIIHESGAGDVGETEA